MSGSRVETGGYRVHSAAERTRTHAKQRYALDGHATLSVLANYLDARAEDPLGLDARQLAQDRTQAGTNAIAYDSRKHNTNNTGGKIYDSAAGARDTVRVMTYVGDRQVQQFLAIPAAARRAAAGAG